MRLWIGAYIACIALASAAVSGAVAAVAARHEHGAPGAGSDHALRYGPRAAAVTDPGGS